MGRYSYTRKRRQRVPRRVYVLAVLVLLLSLGGVIVVRNVYDAGLGPYSASQRTVLFTVKKGSSVKEIADTLEQQHLIKSAWAFQRYVHSKELENSLQAGTYALSPSQGTASIVRTLTSGNVARRLVTIIPGRRIDQVRADLINDGFAPAEVDTALNPAQYMDVPVLSYKPAGVTSLEGLLWPDSYEKDESTSPSVIIRESLIAMGQHLTPDVQAAFASEGLTTYQGIVLASVVIQEVGRPVDQAQAAQVFLSRLKSGIALGSDVTAKYGAIQAGLAPSVSYESAYNTATHTGLPPTPVSVINQSSLNAVVHPAATDWLYFVAGDDGTTYFSRTLAEHQALTQQHCHALCGQ